jgi:hypothetical protein
MPPVSLPEKKKSVSQPLIPGLAPSNEETSETCTNSSSSNLDRRFPKDTNEILAECEAVGIPFVKSERPKVLEFPLHQVKLALAYFLFRYPNEESREEIRTVQGTLIYFLRQKCWNWNQNFLGNLGAYRLVPDWVIKLCISDETLDWGY